MKRQSAEKAMKAESTAGCQRDIVLVTDSSECMSEFSAAMVGIATPNVEVTGVTRQGGQAVRPMMELGGCTAWLTCRGASG